MSRWVLRVATGWKCDCGHINEFEWRQCFVCRKYTRPSERDLIDSGPENKGVMAKLRIKLQGYADFFNRQFAG